MSVALPPLPVEDLDHVLAHTGKFWAGARGAKFFITGGTGFFGTWLLESFVRANDTLGLEMRATVLTRDSALSLFRPVASRTSSTPPPTPPSGRKTNPPPV
jgi:dTDP-glucose 4,6-dehydratase